MNQKLFRAFIIASSITLVTEIIENKFQFNLYQALMLSIPAFIVGILIDRKRSEKEFERKISKFVLSLAKIKQEKDVKAEAIQCIMCEVTKEFAEIFDQQKKVKIKTDLSNKGDKEKVKIKLTCLICQSDHIADNGMNCTNCGLSNEKWSYLNDQLVRIENKGNQP